MHSSQRHRRFGTALVGLALASLVASVGAQELRGRIVGSVRDNTGGVLPGVTVTATSPALIQPQVTVSGTDGSYRFPALPPGLYTVTFELAGFQTVRREEIRVNLNVTLTINGELPLAGVQETLTITGESPVVDLKTNTTAVNFTTELLEDIPNARDIWAAMAQAPGFQMNGYDVGGSHMGTQTGYATYGIQDQNRTLLEGINVTEGTSGNAGYFDYGSFEEYQLGGAGNMAETHGIGAFHNLTVKSGGDDISASFYYDYQDDGTIGDNLPDEFRTGGGEKDGFFAPRSGLTSGNPITFQTDLNADVGGPIWKGHAWFYGSYRKNTQDKAVLGLAEPAHTELENWSIKGTWQINSRNQFIGFFNRRAKLQAERNLGPTVPINAAWYQSSVNKPAKVEWTSTPNDAMFIDVQYSWWKNYFPLYPTQTKSASSEGVDIGRYDRGTGQTANAAQSYYHFRDTQKPQFTGSLSYFKDDLAGNHNFKFGTEIYRERRDFLRFQPGNQFYYDRNGVPEDVDIYNTPNSGINDSSIFALYAQDSWTLNDRVTLNLGLRFDRYKLGWPAQSIEPELPGFFEPLSTPDTTVATLSSLGPRIGLAYDVTGQGKTVAKVFWGRFYSNPSTGFVDDENPVGVTRLRYEFNDMNGNRVLDPGACGNLSCSPELGRLLSTLGGGGSRRVDRDLAHEYGQEISASIEHELQPNLSLRANYVRKMLRNGWAEVDLLRVNEYTIPFDYADSTSGQTIPLLDRPAGIGSDRVWTNPGRQGLPEYKGDYDTFEVALNKRFSDRWLFLASYMYSRSSDFKNTTQSSTSVLQAMRTSTAYNWRPNQRLYYGYQDSSWSNFKVVGRYIFAYDIGVSTSYKWQQGNNWARRISARLPNAGSENIHFAPIADERAPSVGIWDIRFDKTFSLGEAGRITANLDIFNVLNSNTVTNFRSFSGSRFREVIAILDPRVFRFGFRWAF